MEGGPAGKLTRAAEGGGPCVECSELYDGRPPCDGCDARPESLWVSSEGVWRLWLAGNRAGRDGVNGALRLEALCTYAAAAGLGVDEIDACLELEAVLFPKLKGQVGAEVDDRTASRD